MRSWIIFMAAFFLLSCHTPGRYPLPLRAQGMNAMDSFRTNFLQGRLCDALISFEHAIDIFKRIDDMCAISDAYVQKYLFYAYGGDERKSLLETARDYASIGECTIERDLIERITSGTPRSGDDGSSNDIFESVSFRKNAVAGKQRALAEKALEIDRSNGWTLFVILDYDILLQLSDDEAEKERLERRIIILKEQLQSCK